MAQRALAVDQKYPPRIVIAVSNAIARFLLSSPLGGPLRRRYMLLRFTGRKSGRRYVVPVTVHHFADGGLYVLTSARWRYNFRGGADLEVTLDGRTTPMRGELVEDPEAVARVYARRIEEYGPLITKIDIGIQIRVPRPPTVEELTEAAERVGLSVLRLTPKE